MPTWLFLICCCPKSHDLTFQTPLELQYINLAVGIFYPSFSPPSSPLPLCVSLLTKQAYIMTTTCRACQQQFATRKEREHHVWNECLLKEWTVHLAEGTAVYCRNPDTGRLDCFCQGYACQKDFKSAKSLYKHLKTTGAWVEPEVRSDRLFVYSATNSPLGEN